MRAVVQRVARGSVSVDGATVAEIAAGVVVLLGVGAEDDEHDAGYLAEKIAHLRIFEDDEGKLNRSLLEKKGQALVVSQFTLYGDCRKGRRPSFTAAAGHERAIVLYEKFVTLLEACGIAVARGRFREHMQVTIVNDGPVTLLLDTRNR